jgi:hypothetical protein
MRQLFGNGFGQLGSTIKLGADTPAASLAVERSAMRAMTSPESSGDAAWG